MGRRASVYTLQKLLESKGFVVVSESWKDSLVFHASFCSVLLHKDNVSVFISAALYGITVTVCDRKEDKPKTKVVIDQKEVLTDRDYAKVLFSIN